MVFLTLNHAHTQGLYDGGKSQLTPGICLNLYLLFIVL